MWLALHREGGVDGRAVPRCQVERLMRANGLRGAGRGAAVVTTRADQAAVSPDLVNRDFTADRPNASWVVEFTYVPTTSGTAFIAFVSDVCSRRIVGWCTPVTSIATAIR